MNRSKPFQHWILSVALLAAPMSLYAGDILDELPGPVPDDRNHLPEPPPSRESINDFADAIDKQFAMPVQHAFDLPRVFRTLFGAKKQAMNVDAWDRVPDCAWYANRNTRGAMTPEDVRIGPNLGTGPDTSRTWTIIRAKADGVTPGFAIEDARGDRYFIKFDPKGYNELASGAEVVATKLFYAAGYHTPENYVTVFDPSILRMGENVRFTDAKGRKRYMREEDLETILSDVEHMQDGRLRALASRYIPGKPLGPFDYEGYVEADSNDYVPHQHRRELRGLYVFGTWVNHYDAKAQNSLDSYVTDDHGRSYVRHYLIDFGTCLGSGGRGPHPPFRGHENEIDPAAFLGKVLTLGLLVRDYEKQEGQEVPFPSIGRYTAEGFHPAAYKTVFPNPAYENLTLRDAYWGARLVMSFSDEQIDAAVAAGQYSDPEAAAYLADALKQRRDIIGRYWFDRMPPLDEFDWHEGSSELAFQDLAVRTGLAKATDRVYSYRVLNRDRVPLSTLQHLKKADRIPLGAYLEDREIVAVEMRVRDKAREGWSVPVTVVIRGGDAGGIVGVLRSEP